MGNWRAGDHRGEILRHWHGKNAALSDEGQRVLVTAARAAKEHLQCQPVITELKDQGLSLARIAVELNKRKVATPRGGKWDHSTVGNVLERLAIGD